eukprot:TRINITY_DN25620_c0_g1_i1.p2 TRINITY_DN25620_c0_g1~~TRINITY_DN25620_c0_g1_i1.p2  ORF type:complete len:157 (+),score=40.59 TRINITY_DN25620_c0_g1_i1:22-492(+)
MNTAPKSPQEDDVSRLFKSLDLDAFRFRSFDRPGGDASDGDSSEFQASTGAVEPVAEASSTPAPSITLPPAAPAALLPVAPTRTASPVDAAFSRLLRQSEARSQRLPGFRLALPKPPRVIELAASSGHELSISDVLNRLYRLGGSKMSLIRQRGDV